MQNTTNNSKQPSIRQVATTPFIKHSKKIINMKTAAQRQQRGNNRYTAYHAYRQTTKQKDWTQFKNVAAKKTSL